MFWFFLPEIIEKEPEIFDKEFKNKIKCPYTPEEYEFYQNQLVNVEFQGNGTNGNN